MAAVWPFSRGLPRMQGVLPLARLRTFAINCAAAQHGSLLLWMALALMVGIGLHFQLPWQGQRSAALWLFGGVGAAAGLVWASGPNRYLARGTALLAGMVACGLATAAARESRVAAPVLPFARSVTLQAEVLDVAGDKLYLRPIASVPALPALQAVRVLVKGLRVSVKPGDQVQLRARLSPPAGPVSPGGYDFSRVAWFKQIGATGISFGQPMVIGRLAPTQVSSWFDRRRESAADRFTAQLPGNTGTVAAALVVGERGDISPEVVQELRISGLAHLLSVSGFHLVMVAGGLFWGTRHLLAFSRRVALQLPVKAIAAAVSLLGALSYTLLTGAAYPTQRSMIAIAIATFALAIGRSAISLRLLALVTIVLLAVRPEALLDVSFQLSFTGVAALVAFYETPQVKAFFAHDAAAGRVRRWAKSLVNTMLATLVAEVALAPIAIGQFHQLGIYGLLANAVGVPFTGFVLMPMGFLSLVLQPLGLDTLINPLLGWSLDAFLKLAHWTATLPHAQIRVPEIGADAFILIMAGLLVLIIARHALRASGAMLMGVGIISALLQPRPLVRIAPEGNMVAALSDRGELLFPSLRRGRFARKAWMEENAQSVVRTWEEAAAPCVQGVCQFQLAHAHNRLGYFEPNAEPRNCPEVDILIDMRRTRKHWCTAPIYIDKRFLKQSGAIHIHVSQNRLRLVSVHSLQGDHSWAPLRRTLPKDSLTHG